MDAIPSARSYMRATSISENNLGLIRLQMLCCVMMHKTFRLSFKINNSSKTHDPSSESDMWLKLKVDLCTDGMLGMVKKCELCMEEEPHHWSLLTSQSGHRIQSAVADRLLKISPTSLHQSEARRIEVCRTSWCPTAYTLNLHVQRPI